MQITCPSCGSDNPKFLIPLYVRVTFRISDEGTVHILHLKPLESLEEKLAAHGREADFLHCAQCGSAAEIDFNEYETLLEKKQQQQALEGLEHGKL